MMLHNIRLTAALLALAILSACAPPTLDGDLIDPDAGQALDAPEPGDPEPGEPEPGEPEPEPGEPEPERVVSPRLAALTDQIIYLTLPDRFDNGDPGNDDAGPPGCLDPGNPRKFHGGDLAGLRGRLDYLEELGINRVWTTPLYRQIGEHFGACGYHGYWADFRDPDDGALDPRFGDARELDALIDDMAERDMGLILDMVVNHVGYGARLREQHSDWFHGDDCERLGDPAVTCGLAGLPDLAQERPDVAAYLNAMSAGWASRHAIKGIRMDTVKHVPLSYFREGWIPAVRGVNPDLFLVGEYLDGQSLDRYDPYLGAGFDSMFNFRLRDALVDALARGGSVSALASRVRETIDHYGIDGALVMTNLLDNHDVERFTAALQGDEALRARRYRVALAALLTLPGIPQIFYGNELGMQGGSDPDNRRDMPPWAWEAGQRPDGPTEGYVGHPAQNFDWTRRLVGLRRRHAALRSGTYFEYWRPPPGTAEIYAYLRFQGDDRVLVILHNGAGPSGPVSLPIQAHSFLDPSLKASLLGATWSDGLEGASGGSWRVEDGELRLELPAASALVLVAE